MSKLYVQYGCGLCAPEGWLNYDASPTLRIQKKSFLKWVLKKKLNVIFPKNVRYGDIIKGLPVQENSCDAVFCSHTLEHLSLNDFRTALKNTYKILKPGGIFRCIVPDLESSARTYLNALDSGKHDASLTFIGQNTLLGVTERPKGIKGFLNSFYGNSHHLWMWDKISLSNELRQVGFNGIRVCQFNDGKDEMFKLVEDEGRFYNAVAIECIK